MQTSDDSSRADRNAGYCSNSTASICCEFDEQQIEPGRVEFEHMLSRGSAQVCSAHGGFVLSVCRSRFACSARSLDGFPVLIHRLSSGLSHSSATSLIKSGPPHVPALRSVRSYTVCAVLPPMYRWIIWPIPTRTAAAYHSNIIKVFKYY